MLKKIVSIIISLLLIALPLVTLAATTSELNDQKNEINQNIQQAKERQEQIEGEVNQTKSELEVLNDEIAQTEYEVEQITTELNKLTQEVNTLTAQLSEAEEKYAEQYDTLCTRIVAQYKKGSVSYLDMLLNSNTLTEFISSYYLIGKIAEYDTKLLDDIEEQKNIIETSKKEVEKKKSQAADKQSQLKLEEITLSNKRASKNKYISQLSAEEQELEGQIEKYNAELKKIDSQLQEIARQAAQKTQGGHVYTGGRLTWPVPVYSYISSGYGYRGSAATGGVGTANHNGYDIAAAHGNTIVAAEAGTVMKVIRACSHDYPKKFSTRCYCGGGYGNYLMINHGGGLVTLYGHCSTIDVNVGDTVSAGQKIATVGSAGWSTGYHLHFSVIYNGSYVNPGNYLGS